MATPTTGPTRWYQKASRGECHTNGITKTANTTKKQISPPATVLLLQRMIVISFLFCTGALFRLVTRHLSLVTALDVDAPTKVQALLSICDKSAMLVNKASSFPSSRRRFCRRAGSSAITKTLSKKRSTSGRIAASLFKAFS